MPVNWKRSAEGHVESKCGRYEITPLYWGCVSPQSYKLVLVSTGEVLARGDTQSEVKKEADAHWRKRRKEVGILWE